MKTKKLHMDPLDLTALCNGLVFFAPVALLVRSTTGVSTEQFFVLQALLSAVVLAAEVPSGWLTDRIGCQRTLMLYQLTNLGAKGLLLAAWHLHSLPLFVLEAVVEGLGASLASGTRSAYLYRTLPPEQYLIRLAQVDNWGTVGFLVSTVAYGALYRWGGLGLLLDLASCLLDQAENDQIDRLGRQEQRAELLSLFNIGGQPVGDGVFAGVLGGVRPGQRGLLWGGGHRSGRSGAGLCRTPDTEKERVRWNF